MIMRWFLLCLCVLLLAGCSSDWVHSSKTTADFYADDTECQAITGGASMGIEPGTERTSYESCMWDKGWRKKKTIWFFDPPFN
jgi:hypothetical protein